MLCLFFFSSRRRHTRWTGDWSSDVCSSDLSRPRRERGAARAAGARPCPGNRRQTRSQPKNALATSSQWGGTVLSSEERRVGKECRVRRVAEYYKKKEIE